MRRPGIREEGIHSMGRSIEDYADSSNSSSQIGAFATISAPWAAATIATL
jgi:hypothetical protein